MGSCAWGQSSLAISRVFQKLWGWSCLDVMDRSVAQGDVCRQEAFWTWQCQRPFKNVCRTLSGWSNSGKNKLCVKSEGDLEAP